MKKPVCFGFIKLNYKPWPMQNKQSGHSDLQLSQEHPGGTRHGTQQTLPPA